MPAGIRNLLQQDLCEVFDEGSYSIPMTATNAASSIQVGSLGTQHTQPVYTTEVRFTGPVVVTNTSVVADTRIQVLFFIATAEAPTTVLAADSKAFTLRTGVTGTVWAEKFDVLYRPVSAAGTQLSYVLHAYIPAGTGTAGWSVSANGAPPVSNPLKGTVTVKY